MALQSEQSAPLSTIKIDDAGDDLATLLKRDFKPNTKEHGLAVESAVRTLAEQALADTALIKDDAVQSVERLIKLLDDKLTAQVNEIIHHADLQKIEGAWRGLHYLVSNTETDENLKVRVMNIGKKDLSRMFAKFSDKAWDQSPLFKRVYEEEFGQLGGQPYGCLVGDYEFDNSKVDVDVLKGVAQIAAAAHAPFITAPSPSLFKMESWQELSNPRDLTKILQTPDYALWRSFRASEDSRYVGMAMPRFLARVPYGAQTNPVDGFAFEESASGGDHGKYTWANAAFAMAVNINRSFKEYGWCTRIRGVQSGGEVTGLPSHTFKTDDGGVDLKCPTEIAIGDRREAELAKNGLMPLAHRKNTDSAAFIGAQSLHQPPEYDDPAVTANANLGARLPYMFATSRFAHYLKCMVRDQVGKFSNASSMQKYLHDWVLNYVDGDPDGSTESTKAEKPLSGAEVFVTENKANPGYYNAQFLLKPHYQLEGLTISLRLVSQLRSQAGG
jgi:type VI secretion system protein ImpC